MEDLDRSRLVLTPEGKARTADVVAFAPSGPEGTAWSVLLIEKGDGQFKGLKALPGGFLESGLDDRPSDAAVRELFEETGLSVQAPAPFSDEQPPIELLTGRLAWLGVYDADGRDPRTPTSSDAYVVVLDEEPVVEGGDDAARAFFQPVDTLIAEMSSALEGEKPLGFDHDLMLLDALELVKQYDADPGS